MKVKLKKGFTHLGVPLKAGDEYVGDPGEIEALVLQGYADDPGGLMWGWITQPGQSPAPPSTPPAPPAAQATQPASWYPGQAVNY